MPSHIIITGLAGSGKTTLSHLLRIPSDPTDKIISCDNFRYSDSNWTKKPYIQYQSDIFDQIDRDAHNKIIEGAYHDASDPENARALVFHELLPTTKLIIIIKPSNLVSSLENIINRSLRRYTGEEPQGSCAETSSSRARLVIKFVQNYEQNMAKLDEFYRYIRDTYKTDLVVGNKFVFYDTFENLKQDTDLFNTFPPTP